MEKILSLLETYKGRDKVLRLLSYLSKIVAGTVSSKEIASQFDNLSRQISSSRACFRLLDDIPTIVPLICTENKQKDEGFFNKIIYTLECIVDIMFGPVDHIAWSIDHKIIISKTTTWETASTVCWIVSLYINIYKIILQLAVIAQKKQHCIEMTPMETKTLLAKEKKLKLDAVKFIGDIIYAVNYLPEGWLWSGALKKWHVGALGSFTALIGLYQALST